MDQVQIHGKHAQRTAQLFVLKKALKKSLFYHKNGAYILQIQFQALFDWYQLPVINYDPLKGDHLQFIVVISWGNEW